MTANPPGRTLARLQRKAEVVRLELLSMVVGVLPRLRTIARTRPIDNAPAAFRERSADPHTGVVGARQFLRWLSLSQL